MEDSINNPLLMDFNSPEVCLDFLCRLKHTRVEGLVIEHELDQVFEGEFIQRGWQRVQALVLRRLSKDRREDFIVLPWRREVPEQRLIEHLYRTGKPVRELALSNGALTALHDRRGDADEESVKLPPLIQLKDLNETSLTVRDQLRIKSMYWGFMRHLGDRLDRSLQELMIKDLYIQPRSQLLWDLDRFYSSEDGRILYLEAKHKYPMKKLMFGMNIGEVNSTRQLLQAGFLAWHIILVKPVWRKDYSSMYLFFDRAARERALWIGGDMGARNFFGDIAKRAANASTSLQGKRSVRYYEIPPDNFKLIGKNSETTEVLGRRLIDAIEGEGDLPDVTAKTLLDSRLTD